MTLVPAIFAAFIAVGLGNNIPVLQHVFFVLPLLTVFAVGGASSDTQRLLNVVVISLVYGGLSGNYQFAAVFGLLSCWLIVSVRQLSVSAGGAVLISTVLIQLWFAMQLKSLEPSVTIAFVIQLIVIIALNYQLKIRGEARV